MKKNKHYFLKMAFIKTMLSGLMYLCMPLLAKYYSKLIGYDFIGFTAYGSFLLIIGNFILLARAWTLAFDKDARKEYFIED